MVQKYISKNKLKNNIMNLLSIYSREICCIYLKLRNTLYFKIEIFFHIQKNDVSVVNRFYGPIKIIFVIIKSNKAKTQLLSSARKLLQSKINVRKNEAFQTVLSTFAFI